MKSRGTSSPVRLSRQGESPSRGSPSRSSPMKGSPSRGYSQSNPIDNQSPVFTNSQSVNLNFSPSKQQIRAYQPNNPRDSQVSNANTEYMGISPVVKQSQQVRIEHSPEIRQSEMTETISVPSPRRSLPKKYSGRK